MLPLVAALALTAAPMPPTPPPAPPASADRIIQLRVPGPCPDMDPHFVIYVAPPAAHAGLAWLVSGAAAGQPPVAASRLQPVTCPGLRLLTRFGETPAGPGR